MRLRTALMLETAFIQIVAFSSSAFAQQSTTPTASPAGPISGTTAQNEPATDGLSDIVVTATRRGERLQSVPIAVSAVSGLELQHAGITNTRELTLTMPALNFARVNATFQPHIRGVGTTNTSVGDESSVSLYLDGVYQADPAALSMDLLNVERVEVLRGPQGTLFGRNSTGGLINIITTPPSHDTAFKSVFRFGSFNERSLQTYLTSGITDTLAFDVSGEVYQDDGYIRNVVTNREVGERDVYAIRGKLLWEPAAGASVTLTAAYSDLTDNASVSAQPLGGNTSARALANDPTTIVTTVPYTTAPTQPQFLSSKNYSFAAETRFDLGSALQLQTTSGYQHNRKIISVETDATPFNLGYTHSDITPTGTNNFSQEARLLSVGDQRLSFIVGGYYFQSETFLDPLVSTTRGVDVFIRSKQRARSIAGFGEATWEFADHWKLIGGFRYTTERHRFEGTTTRLGVIIAAASPRESTFNKPTFRAILQRDFTGGNIYASFSRGFKSGVYNDFSTSPTSTAVQPEQLDDYEVGIKTDPLPWLRFNLSAFHYNYKNIQLSSRDPSLGLIVLLNAASARLNGGEAELTARLGTGLNVRAYATYLDARYTSFPNASVFVPIFQNQTAIGGSAATPIGDQQVIRDQTGARLPIAPTFTAGGSFDYTYPTNHGDFGATANLFYSEKYYWEVANRLAQPAYVQLNGEISWTLPSRKMRVGIWGRNLTDAVIEQQVTPSAALDGVTYERPRSFGVTVGFNL